MKNIYNIMNNKLSCTGIIITFCFVIILLIPNKTNAQFLNPGSTNITRPFNTHYFFHMYAINPAYIGTDGHANIGLSYKKENGYRIDSGNKAFAYVQGKSDVMKGGGFGLIFKYNDFTSYQTVGTQQGGVGAVELKHTAYSLGGTATYNQEFMDLINFKVGVTTSYLHYGNNKPVFNETNEKFAKVVVDFGILLELGGFDFGFAIHRNNEPDFTFAINSNADKYTFRNEKYVTASYDFEVMEGFNLIPNIIVQQNASQNDLLLTQLNLLGNYKDLIFGGFSYVMSVDVDRSTFQGQNTIEGAEYHKVRLTAAGKLANQFLLAASIDLPTTDNNKMQFETSIGYFFNRDDY